MLDHDELERVAVYALTAEDGAWVSLDDFEDTIGRRRWASDWLANNGITVDEARTWAAAEHPLLAACVLKSAKRHGEREQKEVLGYYLGCQIEAVKAGLISPEQLGVNVIAFEEAMEETA